MVAYTKLHDEESNLDIPEKSHKEWIKVSKRAFTVAVGTFLLAGACLHITRHLHVAFQQSEQFLGDIGQDEAVSQKSFGQIYTTAAVATEVDVCSTMGKDIMQIGGNAVDSAIASALCIGSINSFSSGIGGGGFMLIRTQKGLVEAIDFRETAPTGSTEEPYLKDPMLAQVGALSVGVPGEIRGFELAHKRHGKLPWKELFKPVVDLNRQGFRATKALVSKLKVYEEEILRSSTWSEVFAPEGRLVKEGEIVQRKTFANTLELIATSGADVFYKGPIAEAIVKQVQSEGGTMTMDDMRSYRAILRPPVVAWYKGRKVMSVPPPASGAVLASILNTLEGYDMKVDGKNEVNVHRIVESMRFGFARRSELGDPSFVNIRKRVQEIISKDFAAATRFNISDEHTLKPEEYGAKYENSESHGTTHLSVVDKDNNAVALTSTVNLWFGSRMMNPETGIILNDQIDDFSIRGSSNAFGLPPSPMNYIKPGKRPMSSTVPTIVEYNGQFELAIGGSGGSRIITGVLNSILNHYDFSMSLEKAITEPRLHDQLYPNKCEVEFGFPKHLVDGLKERKHNLELLPIGRYESVVQGVRRLNDGTVEAVSDYRKGGLPDGY
ncbi:gamma-glutamyltranspeptidase [Paraphysoderma sedebokerense]|nr:gamma-glutamyltranspeptidase [Paraphysoderma sedebokerense]